MPRGREKEILAAKFDVMSYGNCACSCDEGIGDCMKVKKSIWCFMYVILSACLFLSCNGKKEQQGKETEKNITDFDDTEKAKITEEPKITGDSKIEENITEVKFETLENYVEKNIPSVYEQASEKEHYCSVILNKNKEIEYYTLAKEEDGLYAWKYTLDESGDNDLGVWTRDEALWLKALINKVGYRQVTVCLGEDSNYYAWYNDDETQFHIVRQDNDSYVEIQGLELRKTDFRQIAVLENGNIVSADMGKECFVYQQEDGSLLTSFRCGWYESLGVNGNQIYITGQNGSDIQHYNAERQVFENSIVTGVDQSIRLFFSEDDIYLCCPKGIYRTKESGNEFQEILNAGTYHFAGESVTLLKFFVRDDTFYIVYGEDGGSIKKYAPAGADDKIDNYLTIYSLQNNDVILDMISEFQSNYPDTKIIYETGEGAEGSVTVADHIRALNARILAGNGPDVLVLDGLPAESYIEKGILSDLMSALAERKQDLLPTILSAYTTEEKIYMLPLRFKVPVFATSGQSSDMYSSLEALVKYSEENGGVIEGGYSYSDFFEMLYYNYRPEIILENKVVSRENLEVFLEQTKRLFESEEVVDIENYPMTYLRGSFGRNDFLYEEADLLLVNMDGGYELTYLPSVVKNRKGEIIGNNGLFFPNTLLGVNSLSQKKDLAYLFFKFASSYEVQKRYVWFSGYPIDVRLLDEYAEADLSHLVNAAGENGEIPIPYFTKEESAQMIQIAKEVHTPFTVDASIWQIIESESLGYLREEKSLEECVDAIASRIQLYLYEQ